MLVTKDLPALRSVDVKIGRLVEGSAAFISEDEAVLGRHRPSQLSILRISEPIAAIAMTDCGHCGSLPVRPPFQSLGWCQSRPFSCLNSLLNSRKQPALCLRFSLSRSPKICSLSTAEHAKHPHLMRHLPQPAEAIPPTFGKISAIYNIALARSTASHSQHQHRHISFL